MMDEKTFAKRSIRAYQIYADLADSEWSPRYKDILTELAHTAREQFDFWGRKSNVRADSANVSRITLWGFRRMRDVIGVLRTARFLHRGTTEVVVQEYKQYCISCSDPADGRAIESFVARIDALTESLDSTQKE